MARPKEAGPAPALPPDDVLVDRLRAGDDRAFALVLDAWSGGMLRLARGFVSTDASAAEVVQDAWLGVIEGIDRFEGRSSLKTWVYRILVNTARRRRAREGRGHPVEQPGAPRTRGRRSIRAGSSTPASRIQATGDSSRHPGPRPSRRC